MIKPAFVLDCSVTLTWVFSGEATAKTDALHTSLSTSAAWVPALWALEVSNVLCMSERTGKIKTADALQFKELLMKLPIYVDDTTMHQAFQTISMLAREHGLTVYDATYLELAIRKSLPLATLDKKLIEAASRVGAPII